MLSTCPHCGILIEASKESVAYIREQIAKLRLNEILSGFGGGACIGVAILFFLMSRTIVYETEWCCIITWGLHA